MLPKHIQIILNWRVIDIVVPNKSCSTQKKKFREMPTIEKSLEYTCRPPVSRDVRARHRDSRGPRLTTRLLISAVADSNNRI